MTTFVIAVIVLAVILLYVVSQYNQFVTTKTRIKASIQEIGNQLKRQADLIPNLVETAKGYLKHEKEVFKMLTDARKQVLSALEKKNPQELVDVSTQLQKALEPIRIVLESNPQLKAVEATQKLMDELRDTADKVMYARRTLIDLTADFNIMIVAFPSNLVAAIFGFKKEQGLKAPETGAHLEVSEEEMKSPKVKIG